MAAIAPRGCLARSLGKTADAELLPGPAAALARAIESYFGAEVEGYKTYRYFDGCRVLRGWISLPLAMGLLDRKEGTLAALFSAELVVRGCLADACTKVASSDRGGGGGERPTTPCGPPSRPAPRTVGTGEVRARRAPCDAWPGGPYMDEDGGDLLAPRMSSTCESLPRVCSASSREVSTASPVRRGCRRIGRRCDCRTSA